MKKLIALLLTATLAFSVIACAGDTSTESKVESQANVATDSNDNAESKTSVSETEADAETSATPEGSYIAGTYEATADGMNGKVGLMGTFSETKLEALELSKSSETDDIGGTALKDYIDNALKVQNPDAVDAVSGATKSYDAFVAALKNLFAQAKGEIQVAETVELEEIEMKTDVVVVGTGISGMSAIVAAANKGVDVIAVEQKSGPGRAGSQLQAAESFLQKEAQINYSWQELADYWMSFDNGYMSQDLVNLAAQESGKTVDWLAENGVEWAGVTVPATNPFQDPMATHMTKSFHNGDEGFITPLYETAKAKGVEFLFDTKATELLVAGDLAVEGIIAESATQRITIRATKVILATGGFGNNSAMLRQYVPTVPNIGQVDGYLNGDGLVMARKIGAELVMNGGAQVAYVNADGVNDDKFGFAMYFNQDGKRFIDENTYFRNRAGEILQQDISTYYMLYDSNLMQEETLKDALDNGSAIKGDSIEDIAFQLGVNAETLSNTVNEYNDFCASGVDTAFGKPATRVGMVADPDRKNEYDVDLIEKEFKLLNPIEVGPFYAVRMEVSTASVAGTQGGLKINENAEVLDINGRVNNLYAVGELSNGELVGYVYSQAGASMSICATFGRIAGEHAAENSIRKP